MEIIAQYTETLTSIDRQIEDYSQRLRDLEAARTAILRLMGKPSHNDKLPPPKTVVSKREFIEMFMRKVNRPASISEIIKRFEEDGWPIENPASFRASLHVLMTRHQDTFEKTKPGEFALKQAQE